MSAPLPRAELHLHIEGTLEPEMVFALAERNDVELPWADLDELRAAYRFESLPHFLDLYYACMTVLRTEADFAELCAAYLRRAALDGVVHVEMFFDPQAHTSRGIPIDTVIDGLLAGWRAAQTDTDISGGLILCFLRDRPVIEAERTLDAVRHRIDDLIGVGLDSAELGYPPSLFTGVFAAARSLGLHTVAHAGEEGPAAFVRQALDLLGAERIDHGVAAATDPGIIARLRDDRIPLTMCPLSNLRLGVTPDLSQHPLRILLDAGVIVTVNSDDPAYFGGYLGANVAAITEALHLDDDALRLLARHSLDAAFVDEERRTALHARLEAAR